MGSYSTLHSATFVFGIHNSVARSMIFSKCWKCGSMGAYKICCRCKGESTKETKQSTKEGDGDGYKCCEGCRSRHTHSLISGEYLFVEQSFRVYTENFSSDFRGQHYQHMWSGQLNEAQDPEGNAVSSPGSSLSCQTLASQKSATRTFSSKMVKSLVPCTSVTWKRRLT